ncbi:DUF6232 family protein [Streptomyces poonensis]|nr:DUF6232 family protein [Streptomyces poonensis]GLJ91501.1 hypothetical protein GCM10017589_41080 [Streptomyces poonensis]
MQSTEPAGDPQRENQGAAWGPPSGAPPAPAQGVPPLPAAPPSPPLSGSTVELKVSKRLLWVGTAAYPLHNIARVYTFTLHPRRKDATIRFLKNVAIVLSVALALTVIGGMTALADQDTASNIVSFVWVGAIAALILSLVELMAVLTAQSQYVLAVETSGPSIAMVTSSDPRHLDRLVGTITHAIEHPEAEFQVKVESITLNPRHYYYGDNVNMYGGTGNVGVANR